VCAPNDITLLSSVYKSTCTMAYRVRQALTIRLLQVSKELDWGACWWVGVWRLGFSANIYSNDKPILLKLKKNFKKTHTQELCCFLNVCCVLVSCVLFCFCFCVFVLYGPFCHGGLKLDISTLLTTIFLWQSLQFIFKFIDILHYDIVCDCIWGQSVKGHGHWSLLLTRFRQVTSV